MQPASHHLISPQTFDCKVQLLREVAATLALAVQTCKLHRHIADMSIPHVPQCSVLLQDMPFQIDNLLKFDVARAVALIISLEEAREALLSAMSKTRVRNTRPGPDEGRRRLRAEEYACA